MHPRIHFEILKVAPILAIRTGVRTHSKYFRSGDNYDEWYDRACRVSKIGIEAIRIKADVLMQEYMEETLDDPEAYRWWSPTRSLASGFGKWSICHGKYCGFVTNASTDREWREDKELCSPKSSLGTYLGVRFNTIESKAKEHMQKLIKLQTPNKFLVVPAKQIISKKGWDCVQSCHAKTLLMSVLHPVRKDDANPALYNKMMEEIYFTAGPTTPLHLKIVRRRPDWGLNHLLPCPT
jgi:hypothetical protein